MKQSTILDPTGQPYAIATEEGERAQGRREAMQRVVNAKKAGALISYAGSFWRTMDVLDVGFFVLYAGPSGKTKKRRREK